MLAILPAVGIPLISYLGARQAAASPTLRWNAGSTDSVYTDYRFLGGVAGLGLAMLTNGPTASAGEIIATGAFASLATSEAFRAQALATAQQSMAPSPGAPAQVQGAAPQYAPPMGSPAYDFVY